MKSNLNVLITGASGFIGNEITTKLLSLNFNIMGLSRSSENKIVHPNLKWIVGNINNIELYKQEVINFNPEVVIHLSWENIPFFTLENSIKNLNDSIAFFKFIFDIGSCKKILVSGSCLEYSKLNGECVESDIIIPNSHFSWAKETLRLWLNYESRSNNCELGWFRIFYVYGPNQRQNSLIPSLIHTFLNDEEINIKNLYNANDFIYLDDVVDAFISFINKKALTGIYNLGSGKSISITEICRTLELLLNNTTLRSDKYFNSQKYGVNKKNINFWANIEKANLNLEWKPKNSFKKGVKKMMKK